MSLRTKSYKAAITKATSLAARLDADWLTLRWRLRDDPLQRFQLNAANDATETSTAPLMSEARDIYILAKQKGRTVAFVQSANRSVDYLVKSCVDKPKHIGELPEQTSHLLELPQASDRIKLKYEDNTTHDLTEPIAWLIS